MDWWRGKQIEGLRLVNGTAPTNGRLEVTVNGTAGSVCNYGNDEVAGVACRQLGLGTTGALFNDTFINYTTPPAWINNITCSGSEARLQDCSIQRMSSKGGLSASGCGSTTIACSSGAYVGACLTRANQCTACARRRHAAGHSGLAGSPKSGVHYPRVT